MPVIVGVPRSGTTLLRVMLDAHSELAIPAETGFVLDACRLEGDGDQLREWLFDTITGVSHLGGDEDVGVQAAGSG
jgi:Sulfotransferase family